jgi:hypothetical protein
MDDEIAVVGGHAIVEIDLANGLPVSMSEIEISLPRFKPVTWGALVRSTSLTSLKREPW